MRNQNIHPFTQLFESTIEALSKKSICWFPLYKDELNTSGYFLGVETEISRLCNTTIINPFMQQLGLLHTSDAANLLMAYLVLTRPAYENAQTYEWKSSYTCRHNLKIPSYFVNKSSPLQLAYSNGKCSNTPQDVRFREFDKKCAELAQELGMTPIHRGNSV